MNKKLLSDELLTLYTEFNSFCEPDKMCDHPEFPEWNCCDEHREANAKLTSLQARADDLAQRAGTDLTAYRYDGSKMDLDLSPTSPRGWVRLAKACDVKLPAGLCERVDALEE